MSDADSVVLSYVEEDEFGQTPEAPVTLKEIRFTSESLHQESNVQTSNEIRTDRQTADIKRTGVHTAGDVNTELSYGSYDDLLCSALCSAGWSTPVQEAGVTYSMDDADNSINDSAEGFVTAGYQPNQWIHVAGFTEDGNNGFFKIVSVAAGKMVLAGGTVATEAAGDNVTVTMGGQIVNGVTGKSYLVERENTDVAGVFHIFRGMMINGLNMTVAADSIITGSFSWLGKEQTQEAATVGTTANTPAPDKSIMDSTEDVLAVLEGGVSASASNFSLALTNNLRQRRVIGSSGSLDIRKGKVGVTGTLQVYFADGSLMEKYLNDTKSSLAVVAQDDAGNAYLIDLPRLRYTSGQSVAGGAEQDCIADMGFTAHRHETEDVTVRVVRFPAA